MHKKTKLSHNPSFDLDFIGQVVHTESTIRSNSYVSLPKLNSRYAYSPSKPRPSAIELTKTKSSQLQV